MELSFRICTPEDLDTLIGLSITTFVDAFEKYNDPADFSAYMAEAFSREAVQDQLLNPDSTFYFAYADGALVGYLKVNEGAAQNEQLEDPAMELERIYVLQAWQGRQFGKQMLDMAIDLARDKGLKILWLGVWEDNEGAIRFYERYGFTKFGEHPYFIGKDRQTDWLMKLDLLQT